jgi:hypothetical protein
MLNLKSLWLILELKNEVHSEATVAPPEPKVYLRLEGSPWSYVDSSWSYGGLPWTCARGHLGHVKVLELWRLTMECTANKGPVRIQYTVNVCFPIVYSFTAT